VAPDSLDAWGSACQSGSTAWITFEKVDNLVLDGQGGLDGRGSIWWGKVPTISHHLHAININVSTYPLLCFSTPKNGERKRNTESGDHLFTMLINVIFHHPGCKSLQKSSCGTLCWISLHFLKN